MQSQSIEVPTLDEALHQSEASSGAASPVNRNVHSLSLDTGGNVNEDSNAKSETSSIIPTSARLSIATTHRTINVEVNIDYLVALLFSILANAGWKVGRERRYSLLSMRSLQPTLPPYEEYRNYMAVQAPDAGPSSLRQQANAHRIGVEEKGSLSIRANHQDESCASVQDASPPEPEMDPENSLTAHYSRIVRTIDSRYTSELDRLRQEISKLQATQAEELALMRNNMDAAYRTEFKKRNQEAEKAKEEAASRAEHQISECKTQCEKKIEQKNLNVRETMKT